MGAIQHKDIKQGTRRHERFPVVVIGGGQAGLSVGYHLARRGIAFVILDAADRVGDAWRKRWDSLRLFTPSHLDGLDGMPFPAPARTFPTKEQMADYLEAYARRFHLPFRRGVRVDRLSRAGAGYHVQAGDTVFEEVTLACHAGATSSIGTSGNLPVSVLLPERRLGPHRNHQSGGALRSDSPISVRHAGIEIDGVTFG